MWRRLSPEYVSQNAQGYPIINGDRNLWMMLNASKQQQGEIVALKALLAQLEAAEHPE
jgi:hypothetical protein